MDLTPTGLSVPREALPIRVPSTRAIGLHSYTRSIDCVVNPETVIVSKLALRSCPGLCSSIHCRHVSALCGPCSRFRWGSLCRGCSATRLIARPVQVHNRWKLLRPLPIAQAKQLGLEIREADSTEHHHWPVLDQGGRKITKEREFTCGSSSERIARSFHDAMLVSRYDLS